MADSALTSPCPSPSLKSKWLPGTTCRHPISGWISEERGGGGGEGEWTGTYAIVSTQEIKDGVGWNRIGVEREGEKGEREES